LEHFLVVVDALRVEVEQARFEPQRIARLDLAQEVLVCFQRERGRAVALAVRLREPEEFEERLGRDVEHDVVIAHVHVPVVVDPFRADHVARGCIGCRDVHSETGETRLAPFDEGTQALGGIC
jgi:hypothetical protein